MYCPPAEFIARANAAMIACNRDFVGMEWMDGELTMICPDGEYMVYFDFKHGSPTFEAFYTLSVECEREDFPEFKVNW